MKRKYTELRHDRRVRPFVFYPAKKWKSCSCCQTQHRVFRAAASCCCCRGSKVRLQAKEEQQQMLFSRFQLRETHSKLSHTVDVVQMADLLQNAFSIIFRVFVFLPSEHTESRSFRRHLEINFPFCCGDARKHEARTHPHVRLICNLGFC